MRRLLLALVFGLATSFAGASTMVLRGPTLAITAATNATPIVVTTTAHGLSANDWVEITGARGNTNANGIWRCNAVSSTTCTLSTSVGNGVYVSGSARMRALGVVATGASLYYDLSKADRAYVHVWSTSTSTASVTVEASSLPTIPPGPSVVPYVVLTTITNPAAVGSYYAIPILSNVRVNVASWSAGTIYATIEGYNGSGTFGIRVEPTPRR